jgi:hypothetical protein
VNTATADRVKTITGTLDALSFDTKLTPVYNERGMEIPGFKRVYREDQDKTLSIVSNDYKLIQHRDAMVPAIDALGHEGWTVHASRIERYGASAFVELVRKDATIKVVGEKVGERLMLRNSYDRSSSLMFIAGAMVLICTNGATIPGGGGFSFSTHHTGDAKEKLGFLLKSLKRIEESLGSKMLEYYSKLDKAVPSEIGQEIIKRNLGERFIDQVDRFWTRGIGRSGDRTGWNLYNGITQYLTHEFRGGWDLRERKNLRSLEMIRG